MGVWDGSSAVALGARSRPGRHETGHRCHMMPVTQDGGERVMRWVGGRHMVLASGAYLSRAEAIASEGGHAWRAPEAMAS